MADLDLDLLEYLHAQSTGGRWVTQGCYRGDERVLTGTIVVDRSPSNHWPVVLRSKTEHLDPQAAADAAWVAEVHNAAPKLLACARRLAAIEAALLPLVERVRKIGGTRPAGPFGFPSQAAIGLALVAAHADIALTVLSLFLTTKEG